MNSAQYPELGYTKCVDGFAAAIPGDANNTFRCSNVSVPMTRPVAIINAYRSTSTTS